LNSNSATGVKDPAYKDTMYVEELVTSGVVNTMPQATITAVADHGDVADDAVRGRYDESRKVIEDLEKLGISYDAVVQILEDEGVAKFDASWSELQNTVTAALKQGSAK
jgi:transaldolase